MRHFTWYDLSRDHDLDKVQLEEAETMQIGFLRAEKETFINIRISEAAKYNNSAAQLPYKGANPLAGRASRSSCPILPS